jgi:hypothetical protein
VRKSQAGDGTAFVGVEPELVVLRNKHMGYAVETVLDTMTYSNSSWETLTGTTSNAPVDGVFQFAVRVKGESGWINVDDWTSA